MGQYYTPLNMDRREHLSTHGLDCGLKMGEILGSCSRVCDAMTILLAHNEGGSTRPGDLHVDGVTGRWAGEAAFYVGDYAADGDMASWRWDVPESEAYGAGDDEKSADKWLDVTDLVKPAIERASGCAFVTGGWGANLVEIVPTADGYDVDIPADANHYMRQDLTEARSHVRARRDLQPPLTDEQRKDGQTRLIVNLDKLEYIDPARFGETPTLAGMLQGMIDVYDAEGMSSIQALNAMLFYNGRRGGGDAEGSQVGRWRGDRIVVLGDAPTEAFPTHDRIRSEYQDISETALATEMN